LSPEHPATINAILWLSRVLVEQGRAADADALLREAGAYYAKRTTDDWGRYNYQSLLGATRALQKEYADAEAALISGYEGLAARITTIPYENRWFVQTAGEWTVDLYRQWGKPEKAAEWRRKISNVGG